MKTLALTVHLAETLLPNKQKDKPYSLLGKHWQQQKEECSAGKLVDFFPPFEAARRFLAVVSVEDGENCCVIWVFFLWQVTCFGDFISCSHEISESLHSTTCLFSLASQEGSLDPDGSSAASITLTLYRRNYWSNVKWVSWYIISIKILKEEREKCGLMFLGCRLSILIVLQH